MTPYTTQWESVTTKVLGRATHNACYPLQRAGLQLSNIIASRREGHLRRIVKLEGGNGP
jgi:hypothetical protein